MEMYSRIVPKGLPALAAFLDARALGASAAELKQLATAAAAEGRAPAPAKPKLRLVYDSQKNTQIEANLIRIRRLIWECDKLIASSNREIETRPGFAGLPGA
jgi:hypothetical protein